MRRELADWKRPVIEENGAQKEIPRIAGISSFGAGGANAHILIEEYIEPDREISEPFTDEDPAVILLSAKQEASLKRQTRRLLQAIRKKTSQTAVSGMRLTPFKPEEKRWKNVRRLS